MGQINLNHVKFKFEGLQGVAVIKMTFGHQLGLQKE